MIGSSESWGLSSTHIHGTNVPVEEPSTASTAELGTVLLFLHKGELALRGVTDRRANAPTHRILRQPGNLHGAIGLFGCLQSYFPGRPAMPTVQTPNELHLAFAVPGDLATPTGGYGYDRRIIEELRRLGWQVDVANIGDGFPFPSIAQRATALAILSA